MNINISKEKKIKEFLTQINSLKLYINKLEDTITELKTKNAELNRRIVSLIEIEHTNEKLFLEKKTLNNRIEQLEKELINIIKEKNNEIRVNENKLENEVIFYKGLKDTGLAKINVADNIIKLNEAQHNYIVKIEQELEDLKNENDLKMTKLRAEHESNYKKLKKKMIDFIKNAHKKTEKINASNIELYSKFSMIFRNQILSELENQNRQIQDLIKEKEKQNKKIFALTEEIIVHNSVEEILKKKNVKYKTFINNYLLNKNKEKGKEKEANSKEISKNIIISKKEINKNSFDKDICSFNKIKKNLKRDFFNCKSEGFFKTVLKRKEYNDYISLDKEYKQSLKNYKILKDQFNTLKDREKLFQKKYFGIIQLYNIALDELIKDEKLIQDKIYINLDNINKGDYDSYTKEEKIKIIRMLIKHILPLITIQNREISKLRRTFTNFDIKANSTQLDISRNLNLFKYYNNNVRNITEDSNKIINSNQKFMPLFDNNLNSKVNSNINNLFDESNSIKSSFWGSNFNNIKDNSKFNKTNGFLHSSYNNNKKLKKSSEIKLKKRGIFFEELKYNKSSLRRYMYIQSMKSENKRNINVNNCLTEKNFSS